MRKTITVVKVILINAIVVAILLELGTPFVYSLAHGREFNRERLRQKLQAYTNADEVDFNLAFAQYDFVVNKALHPYLGFVYDTNKEISQRSGYFGFTNDKEILSNSDDIVKIVITGGSVAHGLLHDTKDRIIDHLQHSRIYGDKEIKLFNLAIDGYKQPQQLMAMNYFLLLGGEFDVWVNLDGFNEIALPLTENRNGNVALFYPRTWNLYARKSLEKNSLDLMADITLSRRYRKKLYSFFSNRLVYESSLGLFLWEVFDQRLANEEGRLEKRLAP